MLENCILITVILRMERMTLLCISIKTKAEFEIDDLYIFF